MIRILLVSGARPNFMKVMPLTMEFKKYPRQITYTIVHTGQHYDSTMSGNFFKDLDISAPDIYLAVGPGTHAAQTAKAMEGIEKILLKNNFDVIIVVGDVNSTLAAALAAAKLGIKVAHVEAGLRSFDRAMPEEINRLLTDQLSDYLFTTEKSAVKNLLKEGVPVSKIFFVGNIMVDSHTICKKKILRSDIIDRLGLMAERYCLVTIHRPSNVDVKKDLQNIIDILHAVNKKIRVVFPVHPRTRKMLKRYNLNLGGMIVIEPLGYLDFHRLLMCAKLVITDSGGIQEETSILDIPCLTIRTTTERPITITRGTNELTGPNKNNVMKALNKILAGKWKKGKRPPLWDGRTAGRITKILLKKVCRCTGN